MDAGALVAVDRRNRMIGARLRVLQQQGTPIRVSSAVVGQVWRDGRRQATLARVLAGTRIEGLGPDEGKRIGELLAPDRLLEHVHHVYGVRGNLLGVEVEGARQHLEQADLAHVTVDDGLPDPGQGLTSGVGFDLGGVRPGHYLDRGPVERGGTDLADKAGQAIQGYLLGGRAAHDREHLAGGDSVGQRFLQLLNRRDLTLEVALHEVVVGDHDRGRLGRHGSGAPFMKDRRSFRLVRSGA